MHQAYFTALVARHARGDDEQVAAQTMSRIGAG